MEKQLTFNPSLPQQVQDYLVCKKMEGLSPATLNNYNLILSLFFQQVNKEPSDIVANDIRKFLYDYQQQRQIARSTIDKYREYISPLLFLGS